MNQIIKTKIEDIKAGRVPQGYKKTPCGVLPCEWTVLNLSDICKKSTQKNKENEKLTVYSNTARFGLVNQSDFFDKDIANSENLNGYYVVNQNDFVYNPRISSTAPCGPISISNFKNSGLVSPLYTVFNLYNKKYFLDYLLFYFESSKWHAYMNSVANYGARSDRMNVTDEDFFLMPFPNAPIAEQEKIAEILGTWDKAIDKQKTLIEKLEVRKKSLMQKLFEPKEGWEKVKFSSLIKKLKTSSVALKTADYLQSGQFPIVDQGKEKIVGFTNNYDSKITCPINGVIVFGDHTGIIKFIDFDFSVGADGTQLLVAKKESVLKAVFYAMQNEPLKTEGYKRHFGILKRKIFNLPVSLKEQLKIADILASADKEIDKHRKMFNQLKQQKKSLMQLLLTGIVRVNETIKINF